MVSQRAILPCGKNASSPANLKAEVTETAMESNAYTFETTSRNLNVKNLIVPINATRLLLVSLYRNYDLENPLHNIGKAHAFCICTLFHAFLSHHAKKTLYITFAPMENCFKACGDDPSDVNSLHPW